MPSESLSVRPGEPIFASKDTHRTVQGSATLTTPRVRGEVTALVVRAREGDARSLDALMMRLYPTVRAFVHRMTGADEANLREDLVQTSIERLYRTMDRFEERSRFSSFVYGVCFRVISQRRRANRVRRFFQRDAKLETPPPDLQGAENRMADAQWARHLLERLTDDERTTFVLYVCEQLSLEEVAEVTGKSLATVKRRLRSAKERLTAAGGER